MSGVGASLAQSLLRRMIAAYGALAVALLGLLGIVEWRRLHHLTSETVGFLAETFAPAATSALWDYQTPVLEALAGGIGAHPAVVQVEILDTHGRILARWSTAKGHTPSQGLTVRRVLVRKAPGVADRPLGILVIASSEALVTARMIPILVQVGVSVLLLLLVVMVGTWGLVQRLIVRPVVSLDEQTRALDPARPETSRPVLLEGPPDELRSLARTLESLRQRVTSHLRQLREADAQIQELNQGLYRAVAHAESANQAKGAFLRRMSHEFLTPLNHIQLQAELLLAEVGPSGQEGGEDLRQIQHASRELGERIVDILDLVDLESEPAEPHAAKLDVDQLAANLRALARPWALARENDLHIDVAHVPEGALADEALLLRALSKLVHNACRFTRNGRVEVVGGGAEGVLWFEVRDTGRGIPAEDLETIFEIFRQGEEGLTRAFGGMGLGLAICQYLVTRMGGTVSAESTPGAGSRFRITLPGWPSAGR